MLEKLEDTLFNLSAKDQQQFALASAGSLWVTFKDVYEKEYNGDATVIENSLQDGWAFCNGEQGINPEQLAEAAKAQIPDMDDYNDIYETEWRSALASGAQNAAISVWVALVGLSRETGQKALETARIIDNTIDLLVNTRLSMTAGDDFDYDEDAVQEHPVMQAELKRQQDAIDTIKAGGDVRTSAVRALPMENLE
jgi:hypothetical protein